MGYLYTLLPVLGLYVLCQILNIAPVLKIESYLLLKFQLERQKCRGIFIRKSGCHKARHDQYHGQYLTSFYHTLTLIATNTGQRGDKMDEQKIRRDLNMGDNLRRLRAVSGLSQEKLCAELQRRGCDIGRSAYAKYEAGELNIRASILVELRDIYQCSYDAFFAGLGSDHT